MVQQVKLLLGMPIIQTGVPGPHPRSSTSDPASYSCSSEAVDDGPSVWISVVNVRDPNGVPGFCLQPGLDLGVVGIEGVSQ